MHLTLTSVLTFLASAGAARENLCFTAHGQSALYCREHPVAGPLRVYDDSGTHGLLSRTPQRARTMHFSRSGQLCTSRRACWGAPRLPVHVLEANADLPKPYAILLGLVCLLMPTAVLYTASKRQAKPSAAAAAAQPSAAAAAAAKPFAAAAKGARLHDA